VLRARSAATSADLFKQGHGGDSHTEIIAHSLMNAFFIAQSHRQNVNFYLVCERTQDYSRTIHFQIDAMQDIGGFHEQALLDKVVKALKASEGFSKEQQAQVEAGISVSTTSFEKLVQILAEDYQLYFMDKKGKPLREVETPDHCCFLLSDHIPMPKKSFNSLKRLGCEKISLGSTMLFASQCISLIHYELDAV